MGENRREKILVVDDEPAIRESLKLILSRQYDVQTVESAEEALEELSDTEQGSPELILLDLVMPGMDGLAFLQEIRKSNESTQVIMLTATNSVKTAVQAMKSGAVDYLNKPFDVDELLSLISETLETGAKGRIFPTQVTTSVHRRDGIKDGVPADFGAMVGSHQVMTDLYEKIDQLSLHDTTVLLTGESGTGKELIAKEIHARSTRAKKPFVALNCAAIPESLIESEIFGHEKGAFTHAVEQRKGQFELADGGTLFLDEIGELSPAVQVKMLRVLQEQEFYRVGSSKPVKVNVRIVAATNKCLKTAIEKGDFREDLFYRINVVSLEAPPLRERRSDIKKLAGYFLDRLAPIYGNRKPELAQDAWEVMETYSWPGNVRELENIIESVLALTTGDLVTAEDLPQRLKVTSGQVEIKKKVLEGIIPFEEAERMFETELIVKALKKADGVQTRAAKLLGISRRILKYKMDKLGITEKGEIKRTAKTVEKAELDSVSDPT